MYSCLLVIRWQSSGKSRSQQEIKTVYTRTLWMMCAVLIGVIFCSSMAKRWLGSNWRFWSYHFLIVPNAPVIKTGTFFVLTVHILLTLIFRSLYLLHVSVSFALAFESSGMVRSISRQIFSFLSCSTISGQFASIVKSVITSTSHIMVVPLTLLLLLNYWQEEWRHGREPNWDWQNINL